MTGCPRKVHRPLCAHRLHDRKAQAVDLFTRVSFELLLLEMRMRHFFSVGGLALLGQETREHGASSRCQNCTILNLWLWLSPSRLPWLLSIRFIEPYRIYTMRRT